MVKLNRQDWENLKASAEVNLKQLEISTIQFSTLLELAEKKLSEFAVNGECHDAAFPDEAKEAEKEIDAVMDLGDETRASG